MNTFKQHKAFTSSIEKLYENEIANSRYENFTNTFIYSMGQAAAAVSIKAIEEIRNTCNHSKQTEKINSLEFENEKRGSF